MNGSDPKQVARELLEEAHPALIGLSHWIHANPELGYQEVLASGWVTEWLTTAGFDVRTGVAGMPTAIIGSYGPGPFHVAICAEYDALPGVGHACGHNVIAAAGVGAGLALAAVADELGLKVTVMGTPAEETGGGKVGLLKAGEFDGVHAAMMVHPWPQDEATPSIIAIRSINVRYTGREAHAAGFPHLGINAADALVVAQTAIALLRQQLRSSDRVHGIVTKGGDAANIIPAITTAQWMVRGPDLSRLDEVTALVRRCFEAGALATGTSVDIEEEICYADVRHDADLARLYQGNAESLGRTFAAAGTPLSTDMGNVSYAVPTIHPMIGVEAAGAVNHQADFSAACATPSADQAILDGALAMAWTAIDAARDAAIRERLMTARPRADEVALVSAAWMMPTPDQVAVAHAVAVAPPEADDAALEAQAGQEPQETDTAEELEPTAGMLSEAEVPMEATPEPEALLAPADVALEATADAEPWAVPTEPESPSASDLAAEPWSPEADLLMVADDGGDVAPVVPAPAEDELLVLATDEEAGERGADDPDGVADAAVAAAAMGVAAEATLSPSVSEDSALPWQDAPQTITPEPIPGGTWYATPDEAAIAPTQALAEPEAPEFETVTADSAAPELAADEGLVEAPPVVVAMDAPGAEPAVAPATEPARAAEGTPRTAPAPAAATWDREPWGRAFEEAAARMGWEQQFDAAIAQRMTQEGMDRSEAIADLAADLGVPPAGMAQGMDGGAATPSVAEATPVVAAGAWDVTSASSDPAWDEGAASPSGWPPPGGTSVSRERIEAEGFSLVAPEVSSVPQDGDAWSRNGMDHASEDMRLR